MESENGLIICGYCGRNLHADSLFCDGCGTPIDLEPEKIFNHKVCPNCGSAKLGTPKTDKPFRRVKCEKCGHTARTVEVFVRGKTTFTDAEKLFEFLKGFRV